MRQIQLSFELQVARWLLSLITFAPTADSAIILSCETKHPTWSGSPSPPNINPHQFSILPS